MLNAQMLHVLKWPMYLGNKDTCTKKNIYKKDRKEDEMVGGLD